MRGSLLGRLGLVSTNIDSFLYLNVKNNNILFVLCCHETERRIGGKRPVFELSTSSQENYSPLF